MGVGFVIGDNAWEIGSSDFLKGFFSTISYYLEAEGWGTQYPELMQQLYRGGLDASDAKQALIHVIGIRDKLKGIQPVRIIWDIDNPNSAAPWANSAIPSGADLPACFITSNGRRLFDVLIECLKLLETKGGKLTIESF